MVSGIFLCLTLTVDYSAFAQTEEAVRLAHPFLPWMNSYGVLYAFAAIAFACFFAMTWYYIVSHNEKTDYILALISLLFGFVNTAGLFMYWLDFLPIGSKTNFLFPALVIAIGWSVLFYIVAYWVLKIFPLLIENNRKLCCKAALYFESHLFIMSFLVIIVCWLPWIISYYPASMDWDVYRQLNSYLGIWEHSNHDPWLSSCVLGVCYRLGQMLQNENIGIFIYVLIRDVILASIYAMCVVRMKSVKIRHEIYYLVLAFYAVTPVWGAYAKHAFKDTFCAGLFCWFILEMIALISSARKQSINMKHVIRYGISALILSLFRNNCIYVILPTSILMIVYLLMKRTDWKCVVIIILSISMYFGYNYVIINYLGVLPAQTKEALSIPFQQTARTVKIHGEDITEEEKIAIDACLDFDSMAEVYDPLISDPIKDHYKYPSDDAVKDYAVTWLKMFFKYPVTYFEAAVGQSYGYYAFTPKQPYWAGNWNCGMTIFDWVEVEAFKDIYTFHYIEKWELVRKVLDTWSDVWDRIPVLNLTDTIAFYTWGIVLVGYYFLRKRQWENLIPVVALLIMVLTCMASPVNDCFRYYAPVAASAPALFIMLGGENQEKKQSV